MATGERKLNVKEVMDGIDGKLDVLILENEGKGITLSQIGDKLWKHHATEAMAAWIELTEKKPEVIEMVKTDRGVVYLNKDLAMMLTAYYALGMNVRAAEDAANAIVKVKV